MSLACFAKISGRNSCEIMTEDELNLAKIHLFQRAYMSGVERSQSRIKEFGEVFTPRKLVDQLLDRVDPIVFTDATKKCLDPACGDGEFLAGVLWRRLNNGVSLKDALRTLYGVDIKLDNINECRRRLLCNSNDGEIIMIVNENIIKRNALTYDFSFRKKKSSADFNEQVDMLDPDNSSC